MKDFNTFIGMDVHKETIAVAMGEKQGTPRYYGEIANTTEAITKLVKKVASKEIRPAFCYEAGPCGYGIYRQITDMGYRCEVVAPSLIPKKAGDRVKTDRRDAVTLTRLYRAGELTAVWVPDQEQEAIRDLTRIREDIKSMEKHARQRLSGFMLRNKKVYNGGKNKWTQAHFRWLERVSFDSPIQQIVFQEYVDAVKHLQGRIASLEDELRKALAGWSLGTMVEALMSLRGVNLITAMTIVAEIGDMSRFESPRQFMAYLGLVPSEYSSGSRQKRGGITKTGNGHVRRVLVESSWSYRLPARKTAHLQRKAEKTTDAVQAIAWKAQKRLCKRYWHLTFKGKLKVQACTAVARELAGFIWAIAREIRGKNNTSAVATT
jgi:transposase